MIEVRDNGIGMTVENLGKLRKVLSEVSVKDNDNHIGLVNVNKRIRLRFGDMYGVRIESSEGEYTRVILAIPDSNYYMV